MRILIVGAGGHGQVVADILQAQRRAGEPVAPIGYVDDSAAMQQKYLLGVPVVGTLASIPSIEHDALVVAVGDNGVRERIHDRLARSGARLATARHPSAIIALGAALGAGSMVAAGAVIGCEGRIGRGVILNSASTVDHHAAVGDFVHIAPGAQLGGGVTVGDGALVGMGAVVLPGITIGRHAVVGAGAVVTRDVPAGAVVIGLPARPVGVPAGAPR